ncbi:hypothetical protein H6P81_019630 [Aristolochia fimbriata]|uniref:Uncharacterized protein n=1 Tax=Aristolochia fimbriata TaxID=158543 RepID=A0AAV7DTU7_ARIFI|nr:hypothetical protein H6P81_019630 [Aristolochia fimbriata]
MDCGKKQARDESIRTGPSRLEFLSGGGGRSSVKAPGKMNGPDLSLRRLSGLPTARVPKVTHEKGPAMMKGGPVISLGFSIFGGFDLSSFETLIKVFHGGETETMRGLSPHEGTMKGKEYVW